MQANYKTQTVVAASNLWEITLAAAPDYESGAIEIVVNALGTSGETYVINAMVLYCITNGTTGVATVFTALGAAGGVVVGSAPGTFAITATVSASVVGSAVTVLVTTANTAGTQSSATITGTMTCWNGHAITIL